MSVTGIPGVVVDATVGVVANTSEVTGAGDPEDSVIFGRTSDDIIVAPVGWAKSFELLM